ncbi:prenyltransferase/squalene oxidase repeat-containing protein [Streptomyces iconiensis]|uniref:Terpene cyclase/mutase family protein n=1 Tax=Streptomyces iconiensis TaxID=1384038 RepID=A0ABT7A7M7_9ACTN|nr:prenyltransferase/squalene oxidase repeat-containing protein [Streptomyces iconiensis]MDJ1137324.1 terpene cyclase/mutase family protein [Streptomyces iconiensis]
MITAGLTSDPHPADSPHLDAPSPDALSPDGSSPVSAATPTTPAQRASPAPEPPVSGRLLEARDRLARRVLARVGADGLLDAPCESRVLESALLLRLVIGLTPTDPARDRLTHHLKHALDTAPPDPIQRAVARAVLGEVVTGDAETERALSRFAHFTVDRKRTMFQTLLAHLGAAPWPPVPLDAYEARGQQSWLALEMAALKILAVQGTGRADALTPHDWAALAPALRTGPAWEANNLARLLGLLALSTDPVRHPEVAAAVTRTARELRPDGGLPFITGMDVFATATGGLALTAAGYGAHPAVARMVHGLAAQQHKDGGFGFTRGVRQSDADDTAYTVEFLRAMAPVRHAAVIEAAEDYLTGLANDDGGIPTFARGVDSEAAMTAGAVNALAPSARCREAVEAAARFLTGEAAAAALHERSWSRNVTNAVHRTVLACDSLTSLAPGPVLRERLAALRTRLLAHLLEHRLPDGGWGHEDTGPSDPISTAYATVALARAPGHTAELGAAVDYLADRQRPDGGFDSVPDQAGPRPLLYDAPALADNCVLLAWGHALRRPTTPRR